MEKIRLLLYATRQKPYLLNQNIYEFYDSKYITSNLKHHKDCDYILNGKIVAECDFEVEKIIPINVEEGDYDYGLFSGKDLLKESCLSNYDIFEYLQDDDGEIFNKGYAIHIKNLNIFDKPKELSDYYIIQNENANPLDIEEDIKTVKKAPQNMMYCWDFIQEYRIFKKKIIISIRPEWLCKILNGEKTIEVRKKVLKEMITDA